MTQLWIGDNCEPVAPGRLTEAIDRVLKTETELQLYLVVDFREVVAVPGREAFLAFLTDKLPQPCGYEITIVNFMPYNLGDYGQTSHDLLLRLVCEARKRAEAPRTAG